MLSTRRRRKPRRRRRPALPPSTKKRGSPLRPRQGCKRSKTPPGASKSRMRNRSASRRHAARRSRRCKSWSSSAPWRRSGSGAPRKTSSGRARRQRPPAAMPKTSAARRPRSYCAGRPPPRSNSIASRGTRNSAPPSGPSPRRNCSGTKRPAVTIRRVGKRSCTPRGRETMRFVPRRTTGCDGKPSKRRRRPKPKWRRSSWSRLDAPPPCKSRNWPASERRKPSPRRNAVVYKGAPRPMAAALI